MKGARLAPADFVKQKEHGMKLIEQIMSDVILAEATEVVRKNKGAAGVDQVQARDIREYMQEHTEEIRREVLEMTYSPQPVRRSYIPKPNGKKRPLGIPTAADRVIQTAAKIALEPIFEAGFSESSFGFRPGRGQHDAMKQALEYVNEGYEWIVDLDIEKYFDTVNHDKLISLIRTKVNDKATLHLLRSFLRAGIMENGVVIENKEGTPQGGSISPLLSNIYLTPFDEELERRGLRFCRFADDVVIFVKSERAAQRVVQSVTSWLDRKLFLKVSATKTKVVRPTKSAFLGFTFWKSTSGWKLKPLKDRKVRLYNKVREVLCRRKAAAKPLSEIFAVVNSKIRGWINYYGIGSMKGFLKTFGEWMRHKVRVVIFKQWKRPRTIFRNLSRLNRMFHCGFSDEEIRQTANSRLGLYRTAGMRTANFLLSPTALGMENEKEDRPGLIDPLEYYTSRFNS